MNTLSVSRPEKQRQRTRTAIVDATRDLLFERGYQALTIQAITDRADLGYGTFYLHFREKDEAVWAVLEMMGGVLMEAINAESLRLPFPQREYQSWVMMFRYAMQNRDEYLMLFGRDGSVYLSRRMMEYLVTLHTENLRAGVYSAGLDLPIEVLAQFMAGAIWRLLIWWLETETEHTPEQLAAMVFQMAYRQPPPAP